MFSNYPDPLEWPQPSSLGPLEGPLSSPSLSVGLGFPYFSNPPPLFAPSSTSSSSSSFSPLTSAIPLQPPRTTPPSTASSTPLYTDDSLPLLPLPTYSASLSLSHSQPQSHPLDLFGPPAPAALPSPQQPQTQLSLPSVPADTILSAASCLAFDPQQAMDQLQAQARPASPVPVEPRRRQRIPGLSKQERTERKKQKHREIDAVRRQREHAVVAKMQQLMGHNNTAAASKHSRHKRIKGTDESVRTAASGAELAEPDSDGSGDEKGEQDEDEEGGGEEAGSSKQQRGAAADKTDKVSVLERAAEHMERMQAVLEQMAASCTKQQQHLRYFLEHQQRLAAAASPAYSTSSSSASSSASSAASSPTYSHPLATLHPYATQRVYSHINTSALESSSFLSSSNAIMIVSLTTGCFLHANDRFLALTGWQPTHLIGKAMMPPPHAYARQRIPVGDFPNTYLVDGPNGAMREARFFDQAERSKRAMHSLLHGQQRTVTAVWRYQLKDARLYDVESTSWLGYQQQAGEEGAEEKTPAYAVFLSGIEHRVRVLPESML